MCNLCGTRPFLYCKTCSSNEGMWRNDSVRFTSKTLLFCVAEMSSEVSTLSHQPAPARPVPKCHFHRVNHLTVSFPSGRHGGCSGQVDVRQAWFWGAQMPGSAPRHPCSLGPQQGILLQSNFPLSRLPRVRQRERASFLVSFQAKWWEIK